MNNNNNNNNFRLNNIGGNNNFYPSVIRPQVTETTAMGACYLAGLAVGYWDSLEEIRRQWKAERTFVPSGADMQALKEGWNDAISRTLTRK